MFHELMLNCRKMRPEDPWKKIKSHRRNWSHFRACPRQLLFVPSTGLKKKSSGFAFWILLRTCLNQGGRKREDGSWNREEQIPLRIQARYRQGRLTFRHLLHILSFVPFSGFCLHWSQTFAGFFVVPVAFVSSGD